MNDLLGRNTTNLYSGLIRNAHPIMLGKQWQYIFATRICWNCMVAGFEIALLHDCTYVNGTRLVHLTHKFLDMLVGWSENDVFRLPNLLHNAIFQNRYPISDFKGLIEIMSDKRMVLLSVF